MVPESEPLTEPGESEADEEEQKVVLNRIENLIEQIEKE